MGLYLGVDGGGSKTLSVVADEKGSVLGVGLGGTGNFQGPGVERARKAVDDSIEHALADAGAARSDVEASYYGMAGADRPKDFAIVRELLEPIAPGRWDLENDAAIGLYAGTGDGIGVGVICGTGTNVIGFGRDGSRKQVGGMGELFGDRAGGSYIGFQAVARAMRGHEGRGPATSLYPVLCRHYGVDELLDLVDRIYAKENLQVSALAPYVFQEALGGDAVAQGILEDVGMELAISADAALQTLFAKDQSPTAIGMGSVFQRGESPLMFAAFDHHLRTHWPEITVRLLDCEPVLGAVYAAVMLTGGPPSA